MRTQSDTIVAIATPPGKSSVGIIRLSGPVAKQAAERIWQGRPLQPRQLTLGWLVDGTTKIDQAMVVYMPAPQSYTGEDVVEIQLHGSPTLLNRVLELVANDPVRLAEPGEFTKRAYLNGKLDFTQAEAVGDIIAGEHQALLKLSADQLAGGISVKTKQIKSDLAKLSAKLVAQLDFSEDDIPDVTMEELATRLKKIEDSLIKLKRGSSEAIRVRDGIKIALVGLPNAGKSTLLNNLLGWQRAIVTEIAGTTRDIIQEEIIIDGLTFRLVDTAGLNFEPEMIERLGIERTIAELKSAQLILLLIEPGKTDETMTYLAKNNLDKILTRDNTLVVLTKSDLRRSQPLKQYRSVLISHNDTASIDQLKQAIVDQSVDKIALESASLTTKRQLDLVRKSQKAIARARLAAQNNKPFDLILVDTEESLAALNELTGEQASAQMIDALFANFCIGK